MVAKFDRKYAAMAAVAVAGLVALTVQSLQTVGQLRDDMVALDRALDVQVQVQRINTRVLELETGQRGYLLTLEPTYLEPYHAGLVRLDAELRALSSAAADRPDLVADLDRLRDRIDAKRAELAQTIDLADTHGIAAALVEVRSHQGKALMDDVRQVLSKLDAAAGAARSQRHEVQADTIRRNALFVGLLTAALGLLMVSLYVLARRDRQRQERLLGNEASTREWLERRVSERTSELEATARSLALNEQRMRGIFDAATDGIVVTDASQTIVEANPAAARLFGCAVTDLIGAPLDRLIPARWREEHRQHVQAFGENAGPARRMGEGKAGRTVMALRFDGQEIPIEAGISHASVAGQHLYTVVHRDISDRLKSEAALIESRSRLAAALASMTDAVLITDAEGRFVEFNDAFVSFCRFAHRDECRRTLAEYADILDIQLADGTPAPLTQWAVPRALRGEVASNVEYRLRRKDSGASWVASHSFAPIRDRDGTIVGAVVSSRDVTSMKQMQVDLADSHAALQRLMTDQQRVQEDERKRIARELHDDLQQSLAAIRMDAIAIGERMSKGQGNVAALLNRIDHLSAAAIASTRRIVSDLRPEMLEELGLVPALEALCAQHERRTGAVCGLETSPTQAAALDGPLLSIALYRIAQEALNNVAKHAKASVVKVYLDCTQSDLVLLRVTDDGVGMRPRDAREPESFGLLGMAERVRALGGHLRVESQAGQGTTIEALVPVLIPASRHAPLSAGQPPSEAAESPHGRTGQAVLGAAGASLQAVIDALDGNVAVIDNLGVIQLVNRSWRDFAARHGAPDLRGCGLGTDYLAVCRRSARNDPAVHAVLQGLHAVLEGHEAAYVTEYPCATPDSPLWFRMHAASITGGWAIVAHAEIRAPADHGESAAPAPDAPVR